MEEGLEVVLMQGQGQALLLEYLVHVDDGGAGIGQCEIESTLENVVEGLRDTEGEISQQLKIARWCLLFGGRIEIAHNTEIDIKANNKECNVRVSLVIFDGHQLCLLVDDIFVGCIGVVFSLNGCCGVVQQVVCPMLFNFG